MKHCNNENIINCLISKRQSFVMKDLERIVHTSPSCLMHELVSEILPEISDYKHYNVFDQ